jgi:acyl-CoA oxidase
VRASCSRTASWACADLDIYVTFEGDNNILLQLVGKRLLTDFARQFKGADAAKLAKFAVEADRGRVFHGAGLRQFGQAVADLGSTARSVENGLRAEQQHELLPIACSRWSPTSRAPARGGRTRCSARSCSTNQAELIEAARAHGELLQWEAFSDAVAASRTRTARGADLAARPVRLHLIEKHLAWYLINGRLSAQRAASVSRYIDRLCARLRPHALDLVKAFGYEPEHVRAPLASGAEQIRQDEARVLRRPPGVGRGARRREGAEEGPPAVTPARG